MTALLLALLIQSPPAGQAPAPPGPNTLSPGARPSADATPVEKKRLGPPAGTPGRAASVYVIAQTEGGTPADTNETRIATAQITEDLLQRGAVVIDQRRAELALAENGLPPSTAATLHQDPRAMKLLELDAVILAKVTTTRAGLLSSSTTVELTLVDSDGRRQEVSTATGRSVTSGAVAGVVGTSGASGRDVQLRATTRQSLTGLLKNYEIVVAPSR